ncbi:MAG: SAF domain-containing protein [Oscillochloridaceae bacterium umkhey_bin13]
MNAAELLPRLAARHAEGRPLRVALLGTGAGALHFAAQVRHLAGLHLVGVATPDPDATRAALLRTGWPAPALGAASLHAALSDGTTHLTRDAAALIATPGLEVVIEASASASAGAANALLAFEYGRAVVMANLATEALLGPLLARRAAAAGLVYSLPAGERPAALVELVSLARTAGLPVVCAGASLAFHPAQRQATPDLPILVAPFDHEQLTLGFVSPFEVTALADGTQLALELAVAANACGLHPQAGGLRWPSGRLADLPSLMRPEAVGGRLAREATLEGVANLDGNGEPLDGAMPHGVFVVVTTPDPATGASLAALGLPTDPSGRYAALVRADLLGGMALSTSVLAVGLTQTPTGVAQGFFGEVIAVARRDLAEGEALDGAGGFTCYGDLVPASEALERAWLPLGLAHGVVTRHPIATGQPLGWDDVFYETTNPTVRLRRLMERTLR